MRAKTRAGKGMIMEPGIGLNITSGKVKKYARSIGADLAGIASADRFEAAPAGHRPADILNGARSVVVCAMRLPESVLEGPATSYQSTMDAIHRRLDELAVKMALYIEESGGKAIPVPSDEPYRHWETDRSYGRGDLSHKHAAQAAGLGKLGLNSMLVTPQYGNRVHLVSVVTDIALDPDPLLQWEPCPPGCARCIRACPIIDGPSVDQAKCRPVVMQRLPKGAVIEACWACRKACPARVKLADFLPDSG
jgi:epoxyqueuosine reductase QueG